MLPLEAAVHLDVPGRSGLCAVRLTFYDQTVAFGASIQYVIGVVKGQTNSFVRGTAHLQVGAAQPKLGIMNVGVKLRPLVRIVFFLPMRRLRFFGLHGGDRSLRSGGTGIFAWIVRQHFLHPVQAVDDGLGGFVRRHAACRQVGIALLTVLQYLIMESDGLVGFFQIFK